MYPRWPRKTCDLLEFFKELNAFYTYKGIEKFRHYYLKFTKVLNVLSYSMPKSNNQEHLKQTIYFKLNGYF